jgi:hypothetical protein
METEVVEKYALQLRNAVPVGIAQQGDPVALTGVPARCRPGFHPFHDEVLGPLDGFGAGRLGFDDENVAVRNPFQLVINQHTFRAKSIARFAGSSGRVQLQMTANKLVRQVKPTDSVFCARRAWDHASK